jgi:hypothetical protein
LLLVIASCAGTFAVSSILPNDVADDARRGVLGTVFTILEVLFFALVACVLVAKGLKVLGAPDEN